VKVSEIAYLYDAMSLGLEMRRFYSGESDSDPPLQRSRVSEDFRPCIQHKCKDLTNLLTTRYVRRIH
jgi:hypothetical protein